MLVKPSWLYRIAGLFIFNSFIFPLPVTAQVSKSLHLTIQLDTEDKNWDSIKVMIQDNSGKVRYERGSAFTKIVLPFQQKFSLTFTKPGTKAKHIDVDTFLPPDVAKKKAEYSLRVLLYKRGSGEVTPEEKALECRTEATVFYNTAIGKFDYRR